MSRSYKKTPRSGEKKNTRSFEPVVCAKCGRGDLTLYRDKNSKEKQYFCKEHLTI